MVPIPHVASFEELHAHLLAQCLADDQRQVNGQAMTIGEAWEIEKPCPAAAPRAGSQMSCHGAGQADSLQPGDTRHQPLLGARR